MGKAGAVQVILYRPGPVSHKPAEGAAPVASPAPSAASAASSNPSHDPASIYLGRASAKPASNPGPAPGEQHPSGAQAVAHGRHLDPGGPNQAPPPAAAAAEDMISALFGAPDSPPSGERSGAPNPPAGLWTGSIGSAAAAAGGAVGGAGDASGDPARQTVALPSLQEGAAAAAAQGFAGHAAEVRGSLAAAAAAAAAAAQEDAAGRHVLSGPTALQAALTMPGLAAPPVGGGGGNAAWQHQQPYAGGAAVSPFPSELPQPSAPLFPGAHHAAFPPAPTGGAQALNAAPQRQQQQGGLQSVYQQAAASPRQPDQARLPTPPPAGLPSTAGIFELADAGNAGALPWEKSVP